MTKPAIMLARPRPRKTLSGNCAACDIASRQFLGLKKGNMPSITRTSANAGIILSHIIYFASDLMVFGLLLAVLIGVISGIIPAYRASKLKPVDALRYE